MSVTDVLTKTIPQAARLIPTIPFTPASQSMLIAIGLQESRFIHRKQLNGPARGFWQFEAGGGTRGVLRHSRTASLAGFIAYQRLGDIRPATVNEALAADDVLACAFARLLLWTDPKPLPEIGNPESAWQCYLRNWRPGKPHRHTWDGLYRQAVQAVTGEISDTIC